MTYAKEKKENTENGEKTRKNIINFHILSKNPCKMVSALPTRAIWPEAYGPLDGLELQIKCLL